MYLKKNLQQQARWSSKKTKLKKITVFISSATHGALVQLSRALRDAEKKRKKGGSKVSALLYLLYKPTVCKDF